MEHLIPYRSEGAACLCALKSRFLTRAESARVRDDWKDLPKPEFGDTGRSFGIGALIKFPVALDVTPLERNNFQVESSTR